MDNNLNNSLQGGSLPAGQSNFTPQGNQPSLADHSNTMVQSALQQPVGSPQRLQMLNTGLQLADAHAQSLPPADGYVVMAPDGQAYAFPTAEKAGEFKQRISSQTTGSLSDLGAGIVGGFIKGTSGFQQLLNYITGQGGQPTLGDELNPELGNTAMGRLGMGTGQVLPYAMAGLATGGAGLAPLGAADLAAGAGIGDVAMSALPEAATQFATGALGTQGDVGKRLETGALAGAGAELGAIGGAYALNGLSSLKNAISFTNGSDAAATQAAFDTINQAQSTYAGIGQKMVDTINALPQDVTASMAGQGEMLQRLSEAPNFNVDFDPNAVTASDVEKISTQLNKIANNSSELKAPDIEALNREFRTWATDALNKADPEQMIGDQLTQAYKDAATGYENMKNFDDFFKPDKHPTLKDATALKSYIQKLAQEDPASLNAQVQKLSDQLGVDLTDKIKAMSYVNKLPAIKKSAFKLLLKFTGLGAGFDIAKHVLP